MNDLSVSDPEIFNVLTQEIKRQENGVEMIASENFVSKAVLDAMGTPHTNKYSEGYPNKRYYGGNEFIDISEDLARERAKKLFGADHANVQPHAGSQANMEAYFAILELKDKILGMKLDHGGHLTHGSNVNFSGKFYDFSGYGVDEDTHTLNMDDVRREAERVKPKLLLSGFSAYPRKLDFKEFGEIAKDVGAYHMSDIAHIAGIIAAKLHENPIPHCDIVTTTTHKTLRGPRGAMILCREEDQFNPEDKKNLAQKIDSAVFPGMQGGPLDHVIAAKAVAFKEALQPDFVGYQDQVLKNAKVLASTLMDNGVDLVTGGTDNHLVLVDLSNKGIGGKVAEKALEDVHIYTNKNMIPFDERSPFDPSGIRLGTPALTTRGLKEEHMKVIGECIAKTLDNPTEDSIKTKIKAEIEELVRDFPMYPGFKIVG
ncbi:serine hydroxymethyltransferase [Candidatus Woesearchaeota archaeon]|nr:serine hydroxymethyltransferase [Candidatus Woesearchaeota archaeon]